MSLATVRWISLRDVWTSNLRHQLTKRRRYMCNLSMENIPATFHNPPPLSLIGPPEIYQPIPTPETNTTGDHFIDLMLSNFNNATPLQKPAMGHTENNSPTFLSSGNHCLDFFFHVVPDTPSEQVTQRLQVAWDEDPLKALKLICNLRGVRGTGKGDREGFYSAALWLHGNHPKTLACNATSMVEFGYYKDLLEILYRLLEGPDVREIFKKQRKLSFRQRKFYNYGRMHSSEETNSRMHSSEEPNSSTEKYSSEEKRIAAGKKAVERYNNDEIYRFLHDQVSFLFAEHLKDDLMKMKDGNLYNFSFAAKWCPSLYSFFDRSTLLCESIARRMFPRQEYPEYEGIEDSHYAYRIRDRLRKEVLVPLRKALKLPEVYIGANQWNLLPYSRVPSIAMKNYTPLFMKYDREGFTKYLESVKQGKQKIAPGALLPHHMIVRAEQGKQKIAAGALLPHQIIASLDERNSRKVASLQWQRMVDDLSETGKLKNCLAICDVSGSMEGLPLEVSVALGLLVSDLSEEPWKGTLITFSHDPQLQKIKGDDLYRKVKWIKRMRGHMKKDFQKVFDQILLVAKEGNLSEEQMIKRLFVFSDMEFDQASTNDWETDYEAITRKFNENGYNSVPEIVFWNLRNSSATPVPSHQKGVTLVSGFSNNLLKIFLAEGEVLNPMDSMEKAISVLNPMDSMEKAISGDEYNKLVVLD